jgi:hypothetical protein
VLIIRNCLIQQKKDGKIERDAFGGIPEQSMDHWVQIQANSTAPLE